MPLWLQVALALFCASVPVIVVILRWAWALSALTRAHIEVCDERAKRQDEWMERNEAARANEYTEQKHFRESTNDALATLNTKIAVNEEAHKLVAARRATSRRTANRQSRL